MSQTSFSTKCPRCGKPAEFAPTNPFRPFCSDRCKLLDLGAWASEEFRVPTEDHVDIEVKTPDQHDPDEK